jgi:hypothetical protein
MKLSTKVLFSMLMSIKIWSMQESESGIPEQVAVPNHVKDAPLISPRKDQALQSYQRYSQHRNKSKPSSPLAGSGRKKQNGCAILLAATHCSGKTNHTK